MAGIPTITLKNPIWQGNIFTPTQYQYQGEDLSILERSLAQREARLEKAYQQKNAIDTALGGIETQLNKAEAAWFTNYKNNIKRQIQEDINVGNPGAAIRASYDLAGKTASDSAILSRIEANKQYTEWENTLKQRKAKQEISEDTYKWAIANNPYQFNETRDSQGNVIGGSLVDPKQVYNTMDWKALFANAAALFRPDVTSYDNKGGGSNPALYDTNNSKLAGLKGKLGEAATAWQNGHQIEQVTSEDIINTVGDLLGVPDLLNQAIQDWEVSVWNYNELTPSEKKDRVSKGLVVRGQTISLQEYLDQKSRLFANALAYKKESTTSANQSSFGFSTKAGTDVEGLEEEDYGKVPELPTGLGPLVKMSDVSNPGENANASGNRLNKQMKRFR